MTRKPHLHEEICDILNSNGNSWITTGELPSLVNQRGRYKKCDGSLVTDFQIHGRTRNYPDLFEREDSRVRCHPPNEQVDDQP